MVVCPRHHSGQLFLWRAGMLLRILEHQEIVLQFRRLQAESRNGVGHAKVIFFAFFAQDFAGLGDLVEVAYVLDELFQTDGNHQPQHNGGDVNEELAPRGGGVLGRMNIEHGWGFLVRQNLRKLIGGFWGGLRLRRFRRCKGRLRRNGLVVWHGFFGGPWSA